jgi:hypothetical protein
MSASAASFEADRELICMLNGNRNLRQSEIELDLSIMSSSKGRIATAIFRSQRTKISRHLAECFDHLCVAEFARRGITAAAECDGANISLFA